MNGYYFDHAATDIPREEAIAAANDAFNRFGNPGSLHKAGIDAKNIIDGARKKVASALRCNPSEVIFTGGGTESNLTAIFGIAKARAKRSKTIVTTDSEHPSVAMPINALEEEGYKVIRLSTRDGKIDMEELKNALSEPVALVSVMLVNNETGAEYDIAAIRKEIDRSGCGALFHIDAVQGFLKTKDRNLIKKNADTASIAAHKVGGIKGIGALYIKNGVKIPPFILGGGQEGGMRSGTENVPAIAAFGAACKAFDESEIAHFEELNDYTVGLLKNSGLEVVFRLPEKRSKAILSISVKGARSEVTLNALSNSGFCVSAGSACSAKRGGSTVLEAYGATKDEVGTALRISFGRENTKEDCEKLVENIENIAKRLVK